MSQGGNVSQPFITTTTTTSAPSAHVDFGDLVAQPKPRPAAAIKFQKRPKRPQPHRWYYREDNLVEDGKCVLRMYPDLHGEVRLSAPTQHLLNGSAVAREEVMDHYGAARRAMPTSIMVDVSKWAPNYMREMRRAMDPTAALRDGVDELLGHLMRVNPLELDDYDRADLVCDYGRLRDRVRELREEFAQIEAGFELAQAKLVQIMGGDE